MSKKSVVCHVLAGAILAMAVGVQAAAPDAPAPAAPPPARGGRGGPAAPANLGGAMRDMNAMLTALKADATDASKIDQVLRNIATLERDVAISKLSLPPLVNRMTGDEKAKSAASYRTTLSGLARTLLDLEDAVSDKKTDDIKKLVAKLEEIEKAGHTEFRPAP